MPESWKTAREVVICELSAGEWERLMASGQGDWIQFDLSEVDGDFLAILRAGKLLAYLQHQPHETRPDWHVFTRLETRPSYRRRGYARRLIAYVRSTRSPVCIVARGVLSGAVSFWQKMGFAPDGYGPEVEGGIHYSEGSFVWLRPRDR